MKNIIIVAFVALLVMACSGQQKAATSGAKSPGKIPVIVVLDVDRVIKEAAPVIAIQSDLTAWAEAVQTKIQARADEVTQASERNRPAKELDAMKMAVMQMQQEAREELQNRQNAAADKMTEILNPVVAALAKENGWDVVLNKTERVTVWASDAVDQSDLIIQRLNATGSGTGAAAPTKP